MKRMRILVPMHESLVPPESLEDLSEKERAACKTEFDVLMTLREMGHEAVPLGVYDDLSRIRETILEWRPHIVFNMLEEFHGVGVFDQHVVAYLELMRQRYTGCNPRGLLLARDKALSKKLLVYHRISTPRFTVYPKGRKIRPPKHPSYPLLVKSVAEEASLGISQASIVRSDDRLIDRVAYIHGQIGADALVEEYIDGREFYVGVMGNVRLQTFPVWELLFTKAGDDVPRIATAKVKWDEEYQKKLGLETRPAEDLTDEIRTQIQKTCKRVFRVLNLSGYARMDLRLRDDGRVFVLEANPNPNLSYGEDFAESAESIGITYEDLLGRIISLGRSYRAPWQV